MSSEILGGAEDLLKGNLGGAWDIKHGYADAYTDLGISRKFGGAAAAYSLRDIGAMNGRVVRVRRDADNEERDFSAQSVKACADWCNGLQEIALPADLGVASFTVFDLGAGLQAGGVSLAGGASLDDFDGTFTPNADGTVWTNGSSLGVTYSFGSGSWVLSFDDGNNVGSISISSTTKFPFQVTNWGSAGVSVGAGASGLDSSTWSNAVSSYLSFVPFYGSTTVYPTAEAAYSLRKIRSTYTGNAAQIRRASDNIEVNVAFDDNDEVSTSSPITNVTEETTGSSQGTTTATTLGDFLTEDTEVYASDYSSGTDSWTFGGGSVAAPESIGGEDNALKVTKSGSGFFFPQKTGVLVDGKTYSISIKLYVPSSNTNSNLGFNVREAGGGPIADCNVSQADAWESFTVSLTSGAGNQVIQVTSDVSMSDGDVLYIKDVVVTQTTDNDATVVTWYDQSGKSNDATQLVASAQPLIAQSGSLIDGGKSLLGDNTERHLDFGSSITVTGDFSIFYKLDPAGRTTVLGPAAGTTPRLEHPTANTIRFATGTNYDFTVTSSSFSDAVVSLVRDTSDSGTLNQNGTLKGTKTLDSHASFTFAQLFAFGSNSSQLDGKFSEIIIYNFDQSNNRFRIESNMNNHYEVYTASKNGFVNRWYDQSGNGKNAVAAADADEPEIVKNGNLLTDLGGRPEIQFDGSSHHFNVNFGSDLDQPNTIVMVHQSDTTTATKNEFFDREGTSDNPRTLFDQVSSNYRMLAQATGDTGVAVDTNKNLVVALYNGSSSVLTKNGTAGSAFNSGTQGINQNSEIGRSDASSGNYEGTMQEFIVYNANQSSVQTALEANIKNHYGIS